MPSFDRIPRRSLTTGRTPGPSEGTIAAPAHPGAAVWIDDPSGSTLPRVPISVTSART